MSAISWFIAVSLVLILTAGIASAATETYKISYSGKLTNAAGTALTGTYNVTFRLYNIASAGTALATDAHNVTAASGQFTTTLTFPAANYNGQQLYVSMQRSPDPEKARTVIYPVPYALGLRPGAIVTGSGTAPVLQLLTSGTRSKGLDVTTSGTRSTGVTAATEGDNSVGMGTSARGTRSEGVRVYTTGDLSMGVNVSTSGDYSNGMYVFTSGHQSNGVTAATSGDYSDGLSVQTLGYYSDGLSVQTSGNYSEGLYVSTFGRGSDGVLAHTENYNSVGVHGISDAGIGVLGEGTDAAGVHGTSTNKAGVWGVSENDVGIYGETSRTDHMYGIMTRDYMSAARYDTNAGDIAEYMDATENVSPGTVMIIGKDGRLATSTIAYDTRVAGIVSTTPGVALGTRKGGNTGQEIIAVAGRVPCRVDASYGAIHAGDVLTTSDNPGYAMKARPVNAGGVEIYKPATVLGKAMGSLESGTGTIDVLVTLQ